MREGQIKKGRRGLQGRGKAWTKAWRGAQGGCFGSSNSSVWWEQRLYECMTECCEVKPARQAGPWLTSGPGWHSGAALPHPPSAAWHSCLCDMRAPHQQNSFFLPPQPAPPSVRHHAMGRGWHLHRCPSGRSMATSGVSQRVAFAHVLATPTLRWVAS